MSGRREFLALLGGAVGGVGLPGRRRRAPRIAVDARATIFRKAPDGQLTLVQFTVTGSEAIAGRLRVYDARARLLGTAGVLRGGDALRGELWLSVDRRTQVRTELETPDTRRPVRSIHTLEPAPKWIVHWIPIAPIDDHAAVLRDAAFLVRGAVAGATAAAGLRLAPVPPDVERDWGRLDHLDLLRVVAPAAVAAAEMGVPLGDAAPLDAPPTHPGLALALAGSGVRAVLAKGAPAGGSLRGPDGSAELVLGVGRGANPSSLGLHRGVPDTQRRIEAWLATFSPQPDSSTTAHALITGATIAQFGTSRKVFDDWNATFAYPKLVLGELDAYRQAAAATDQPMPPTSDAPSAAAAVPLDETRAAALARQRRAQHAARTRRVFRSLADALGAPDGSLEAAAARFAFPIAGIVVFNPTPFARDDIVETANGGLQFVTDVPANGYAMVPAAPVHAPAPVSGGALEITGAAGRIAIDRMTGAIAAIDGATRGWIDPGLRVNDVAGAHLDSWVTQRLPGIGTRVDLARATPAGLLRSRVTVYDALPVVDLENAIFGAPSLAVSHACFAQPMSFQWEVAGGTASGAPPSSPAPFLRWIALRTGDAGATIAADGAGAFTVDATGRVTLFGASPMRCRLTFQATILPDDPWRAGWSVVPLAAHPAGASRPNAPPSFGSLFVTDQAGVVVLDVVPVDGGAIVYVQEVAGVGRSCRLVPGVMGFEHATLVDFAGRPRHAAPVDRDGSVAVTVAAFGFAAVRVEGLRLNPR